LDIATSGRYGAAFDNTGLLVCCVVGDKVMGISRVSWKEPNPKRCISSWRRLFKSFSLESKRFRMMLEFEETHGARFATLADRTIDAGATICSFTACSARRY
jgi:hypothetical protein